MLVFLWSLHILLIYEKDSIDFYYPQITRLFNLMHFLGYSYIETRTFSRGT